jgi:hypothetical protein
MTKKRLLVSFLGILILSLHLFGQQENKTSFAIKTDKPVKIDGLLDEPIWEISPDANDFLQSHPEREKPDSVKTSVKITYDESFLYFGFQCFDSQPDQISARIKNRDADMRYDDSIYILIDAASYMTTYFYFIINPLGTQSDGTITKDGRIIDPRWNEEWRAAVQYTDFGWSAEIALDLSNLGITPEEGKSIGIIFSRVVPRLDSSFWTEPLDPAFIISEIRELKTLALTIAAKKTQVSAYVMPSIKESPGISMGVETRHAFSQKMSGRLVINPDFATVEPDEEQFNLTRYEIRLPEKREFFQEHEEIYNSPIPLFYSKRIGDIYGGVKLYGKSDSYEFSGFSVQAKNNEDLNEDSANFSLFTIKKTVLKSSTIRMIAANKFANGKNIGTAGIDTVLNITSGLKFTGQAAISYGEKNTNNMSFFLSPSYDSESFHFHFFYQQIDKSFGENANKVGYIKYDNSRELNLGLAKTFNIKKGSIERIKYDSNYDIYWGMDNTLRSWQIDEELSLNTRNNFFLGFHYTEEYKLYEKSYRNNQTRVFAGWDSKKWQMFTISLISGRNFEEQFRLLQIDKRLYITKKMSMELALSSLDYPYRGRGKDLRKRHFFIAVIRLLYNFNDKLFAKFFIQHNQLIDKLNIQTNIVYMFKPPFGSLQFVFQSGAGEFGEKGTQGNTIFLKLTYGF